MSGNQLVKKISFFDLRKNESMTQARKEGKEAVDSLRLLWVMSIQLMHGMDKNQEDSRETASPTT